MHKISLAAGLLSLALSACSTADSSKRTPGATLVREITAQLAIALQQPLEAEGLLQACPDTVRIRPRLRFSYTSALHNSRRTLGKEKADALIANFRTAAKINCEGVYIYLRRTPNRYVQAI